MEEKDGEEEMAADLKGREKSNVKGEEWKMRWRGEDKKREEVGREREVGGRETG